MFSIIECGLTEAQAFIKPLIAELQAGESRKSLYKDHRDIGFDVALL